MAGKTSKKEVRLKQPVPQEIVFKCRRCEKLKPISEMRRVTRFIPVLVVCQDCEKEMR
jgi:hypothetical protein